MQRVLRIVQTAANGPFGDTGHLRDFRRGHLLEETQDDHFAEIVREHLHGRPDRLSATAENEFLERIRFVLNIRHFPAREHLGTRRLLAEIHAVEVQQDRVNPIIKGSRRTKLVNLQNRLLKRAKDQVLRLMRIAAEHLRGRRQPRTVLCDQTLRSRLSVGLDFLVDFHCYINNNASDREVFNLFSLEMII